MYVWGWIYTCPWGPWGSVGREGGGWNRISYITGGDHNWGGYFETGGNVTICQLWEYPEVTLMIVLDWSGWVPLPFFCFVNLPGTCVPNMGWGGYPFFATGLVSGWYLGTNRWWSLKFAKYRKIKLPSSGLVPCPMNPPPPGMASFYWPVTLTKDLECQG